MLQLPDLKVHASSDVYSGKHIAVTELIETTIKIFQTIRNWLYVYCFASLHVTFPLLFESTKHFAATSFLLKHMERKEQLVGKKNNNKFIYRVDMRWIFFAHYSLCNLFPSMQESNKVCTQTLYCAYQPSWMNEPLISPCRRLRKSDRPRDDHAFHSSKQPAFSATFQSREGSTSLHHTPWSTTPQITICPGPKWR